MSAIVRFWRPRLMAFSRFGIAIAAMMPMIATTISNSISVKPFCFLMESSCRARFEARPVPRVVLAVLPLGDAQRHSRGRKMPPRGTSVALDPFRPLHEHAVRHDDVVGEARRRAKRERALRHPVAPQAAERVAQPLALVEHRGVPGVGGGERPHVGRDEVPRQAPHLAAREAGHEAEVGRVARDRGRHRAQVRHGALLPRPLDRRVQRRDGDRGHDADDRHGDQQLDKGEPLRSFAHRLEIDFARDAPTVQHTSGRADSLHSLAMLSRAKLPPAVLVAFWVALYLPHLFAGQTLPARDVAATQIPWRTVWREQVASGSAPLWDPTSNGGRPLLANPNAMAAYPGTLLFLLLSPEAAAGWHLALHHLLLLLGCYRLARRSGGARGAAAVAAAAAGTCGVAWSSLTFLNSQASLVWAVWALAMAVPAPAPGPPARGRALATGAFLGLSFLAGEPVTAALGAAACAAVTLAWWRPRPWVHVAVMAGAAGMLAAPVLVPLLAIFPETVRGGFAPAAGALAADALAPRRFLELVFPNLLGAPLGTLTSGFWAAPSFPWPRSPPALCSARSSRRCTRPPARRSPSFRPRRCGGPRSPTGRRSPCRWRRWRWPALPRWSSRPRRSRPTPSPVRVCCSSPATRPGPRRRLWSLRSPPGRLSRSCSPPRHPRTRLRRSRGSGACTASFSPRRALGGGSRTCSRAVRTASSRCARTSSPPPRSTWVPPSARGSPPRSARTR